MIEAMKLEEVRSVSTPREDQREEEEKAKEPASE